MLTLWLHFTTANEHLVLFYISILLSVIVCLLSNISSLSVIFVTMLDEVHWFNMFLVTFVSMLYEVPYFNILEVLIRRYPIYLSSSYS